MSNYIKNILIGIFVLAAIGLIVFMLLFLHPSVGDSAKTLIVRFADIDKVNVGTRVTYAGRPVGEVVSIKEIPEAHRDRSEKNGEVYVYELTLKVDSSVDVFNSDEIVLRTSGLLGERNIEITPLPQKVGEKLEKIENQVVYAAQTGSVEETLKHFGELSKKFELVLDDVHTLLQDVQKEKIVEKISSSITNIEGITDTLNQPKKLNRILDNIVTLTDEVNRTWKTVDKTVENLYHLSERANASWNTVDSTLHEVYATAAKANQIVGHIRQGRGTVGKIVMNEELFLRLKSLLHKGETTMNNINTYGILFQLDKRWQRLQAQRMNLLKRLASPEAFASYFENEMNQISSSLSQVTMILNESDYCAEPLMYHPCFTQRFSELLKGIEHMEESMKMYNEQVVEQAEGN
jgi:phospholipid/cholesterol/gamma-HCH transport system substrate-binding protein